MKHFLLFTVLCVLLLPGCGGRKAIKTEPVSGIVSFNGQVLDGATVTFSPVDRTKSNPASGITDAQGKYVLQTLLGDPDAGTTPGMYKVVITKSEYYETGQTYKDDNTGEIIKEMKPKPLLPKKYSSTETTPLVAEVKEGKNTFDFTVEGK
ncbi:MAG: hypothetical protein LBN39_07505 [Planctomycetaceae bacterium]|jgi:hypothetical protein|nr:hypothetical protein [Planctomycetaceae bacterium]